MAEKKYLSLDGLTEYDALIKAEIANKADGNHAHDDTYYTETEIDTKLEEIVSTIPDGTITDDTTGLIFKLGIADGALYCQQVE